MFTFSSEISFGNLLTIGGFIVFITMYIVSNRYTAKLLGVRLGVLDATMEDFKREIKALAVVITQQALQDQRITTQDDRLLHEGKRVDELERRVNQLNEHYTASELMLARRRVLGQQVGK